MKTLNEFIEELQNIKKELKDKPVKVVQENGMMTEPEYKIMVSKLSFQHFDKSENNVECIVIN